MSIIVKLRRARVRPTGKKALRPRAAGGAGCSTTSAAAIQRRNHDLIWSKSQPPRISQHSICIRGADMNFTHIRAFMPYAVLGAGLIIVVCFLVPPSATLNHSLGRVTSIANERSQNAQPVAGAEALRGFAPQGPWLDAVPVDAKKGLGGAQVAPSAVWQTAIDTEGDTATRLSPAEQPNQACSAWLQDWSDPDKHEGKLEWILGFITGSNYRSEGQGQPENADFMAAAALVQESGGPAALHEFEKFTPASQALKTDATKPGAASADENEISAVASDGSKTPATCKRYLLPFRLRDRHHREVQEVETIFKGYGLEGEGLRHAVKSVMHRASSLRAHFFNS